MHLRGTHSVHSTFLVLVYVETLLISLFALRKLLTLTPSFLSDFSSFSPRMGMAMGDPLTNSYGTSDSATSTHE